MSGLPVAGPRSPSAWWLLALGTLLLLAYGLATLHGPALADEFIYLGGARHFAETGSLDARYYDARALVERGYPHHDVHTPGYVILLGAAIALVGGTYWTAVALNAAAYLAGALLLCGLSRALGCSPSRAFWAGVVFLLLPVHLPYVFWAMAELTLGALLLATLFLSVRYGHKTWGAVLAGLAFGLGFLVRESLLFALPALVVVLWRRRRLTYGLGTIVAFVALVYVPLSRDRAPGGANFWAPSSGTAFGYEAVQAAETGDLVRAGAVAADRAVQNLREVATAGWAEKGILVLLLVVPIWAFVRCRATPGLDRHVLWALGAGWAVIVVLLFTVYVVGRWSGLRYMLFLVPAFVPWLVASGSRAAAPPRAPTLVLVTAGALLNVATLGVFNDYKASRQKRQNGIAAYVEKYVPVAPARIVLPNGWLYGLRHAPVEVISSLPASGQELRLLERELFFDCLVVPGDSPLGPELDGRKRYRRLNAGETDPPLRIYARLK